MKACIKVVEPEAYLKSLVADESVVDQLICLQFGHKQYYLSGEPVIDLIAVVGIESGDIVWGAVCAWSEGVEQQLLSCDDRDSVEQWCSSNQVPVFCFNDAISLQPIAIPKPWGQEIWYTGIESRGQSNVGSDSSQVPLPWLLALMPSALCGNNQHNINLLKILDPLPEPVYGDLYYEQHEEKQEVYVVTHVDPSAWPAGVGGISIGFDDDVRKEFASDEACKKAFAKAVAGYEVVRRKIDDLTDGFRLEQGLSLEEPVMAEELKGWLSRVPSDLLAEEVELRRAMDRFKGVKSLRVGDVLKVPCYTPHSLMHGVRTIEFQTPVYERQIISFAQKVLTQPHWDTQQALASMDINMPDNQLLAVIEESASVLVEEVVNFDSFYVWRLTLKPGGEFYLDALESYALAIGVEGQANVSQTIITPEQGVLIPGCTGSDQRYIRAGEQGAVLLLSFPKSLDD
ncbi:MAG: hypothetical protein AseanaTS_18040 [Candidatus Pelagadaptatus aseana]|uniref:hypothetical protein n=1 Tax=Candidatus Pelagadaptatus aseana TaxID=3120508 RepID=UPI0039B274D2